ncbi:MAG TPA: MEDS domain-containing protein [Acidimicrobiia bacterium]|nr:MEDS domain-containing protein [Acidimicrobiia bacterium]
MPTRSVTINGLRAQTGDHICAFYRGREERDLLVVPFLQEGVRAGDVCLCITGRTNHRHLERSVLDGCDDADPELLQMDDAEDTYLAGGSFSADRMLTYWSDWGHKTFEAQGRTFARAATDMSWAQNVITGRLIDDFMGYEVQATRYARAYPQVALCLYDLEKFRGNVIIPVLKVHPKVFFGGMLLENPYYVDPDDVDELDG